MTDDLDRLCDRHRRAVEEALERRLTLTPDEDQTVRSTRLWEAMRYSVLGGGKRLRPVIVLLSAEACGAAAEPAMPAAVAVELVHAYSLIHDDLPSMDNDDFRRGKPSCHRAFGEATAILAGDALQALAFEVLTEGPEAGGRASGTPDVQARLARELALAIGPRGMALGQAADIQVAPHEEHQRRTSNIEHPTSNEDGAGGVRNPQSAIRNSVEFIHRHKTAALIRACARMGAIAAGAEEPLVEALGVFGEHTGLAFQAIDDILDATGTSGALGKTAGKDRAAGKVTLPGVLGLAAARAEAARLTREAVRALALLGDRGGDLAQLAERMLLRVS